MTGRPKGLSWRQVATRQVLALGWVSLLTDAASEMVYPLLPQLLAAVGAGAAALGLVEGCAEAVAAVCKVWFGSLSDRVARRKPFAAAGYTIAALARPLFALAAAPWHVVAVRSADRIGKGMRGAPRDALLAGGVPAEKRAAAFGLQRMMDNLGAAIGGLLAFSLLAWAGVALRTVFVLSIVPAFAAVLVLLLVVQEQPREQAPSVRAQAPAGVPPAARKFLVAFGVFSLANSADVFLLKRLLDLGLEMALLPIAWVFLQVLKSLVNVPGGVVSDRFGHRRTIAVAWVFYAVAYALFAVATSIAAFWAVMVLYVGYYGLSEGGQRAAVAELVPAEARGRAFGWLTAIEGVTVLPANALFGLVYARYGAAVAFGAGAALALAAVLLLAALTVGQKAFRTA
jgi:MFS family permease